MTPPRRFVKGATQLVTRRCTQRQFLLEPSARTNAIVEYLLAHYSTVHKIHVHAFCFLSDHYHLVLTDPEARVSEFLQDFNGLLARALNALHGRRENLWASGEASIVELFEPETFLEKIVYTIANPVSSWLVPESRHWKGLRSQPEDIGTVRTVRRPDFFFRKEGKMPPAAHLEIHALPGETPEASRSTVKERVAEREAELRRLCAAEGRSFVGSRRLYLHGPQDRATSFEEWGKLSPRIACMDPKRRIEELRRLKEFWAEYRAALRDYCRGIKDVIFPAGTYKMREFFGVRCAVPLPEG